MTKRQVHELATKHGCTAHYSGKQGYMYIRGENWFKVVQDSGGGRGFMIGGGKRFAE